MTHLTTEQLDELTQRINDRLDEFEGDFGHWPRGMVRLVYDVITEWQSSPDKSYQERIREYQIGPDGTEATSWQRGYEEGYQEAERTRDYAEAIVSDGPEAIVSDGPEAISKAEGQEWRQAAEELVGKEALEAFFGPEATAEPEPQQLSESAVATLGPEHVVVNPVRPSVPEPNEARKRLAHALANGLLLPAINNPRTLAEADAEEDCCDEGEHELDERDDKPRRKSGLSRHRRAQLEAQEQRRKAHLHARQSKPTLEQVVAELRRQSMAGVMPSQQAYDDAKPAVWAKAQATCLRLGMSWDQLAAEAGLLPSRQHQRDTNATPHAGVSALESEPAA